MARHAKALVRSSEYSLLLALRCEAGSLILEPFMLLVSRQSYPKQSHPQVPNTMHKGALSPYHGRRILPRIEKKHIIA
jgi:hypothetical protein